MDFGILRGPGINLPSIPNDTCVKHWIAMEFPAAAAAAASATIASEKQVVSSHFSDLPEVKSLWNVKSNFLGPRTPTWDSAVHSVTDKLKAQT